MNHDRKRLKLKRKKKTYRLVLRNKNHRLLAISCDSDKAVRITGRILRSLLQLLLLVDVL